MHLPLCVCVCVCLRKRERESKEDKGEVSRAEHKRCFPAIFCFLHVVKFSIEKTFGNLAPIQDLTEPSLLMRLEASDPQ